MDPRNSTEPGSAGSDGAQPTPGLDRPSSSRSPLPSWVSERARDSVESSISQKGAAYQGAVEAVLAQLIAIGIGFWLDARYETAPRYIFAGAGLGFAAMVMRLLRLRKLFEPGAGDAEPPRQSDGPKD